MEVSFNPVGEEMSGALIHDRNLGVMIALMVFFMTTYLVASDLISAKKSKGEVLLFLRGSATRTTDRKASADVESTIESNHTLVSEKNRTDISPAIAKHTAVFTWSNICYDIKIKKENRRILDDIEGFVKPGTLTALTVCWSSKDSLKRRNY